MSKDLLTGNKVSLRALEPADVERLYEWENDPSVWGVSNTLAPWSRYQLEQYVMASDQDIIAARQLRLMIDVVQEAPPVITIGTIDLFDFDSLHLRAGVGILICEPYRKQGYAFEALSLLILYVKKTLHLHQLYCNISRANTNSINLFQKLGFVRCGEKKEWINFGDRWEDEWMFQKILPHV